MKEKLIENWKSQDWTMYGIIISIFIIWRIGLIGNWSKECWILLLVCLLGVRKDQIEQKWPRFFIIALPLLLIFAYFYGSGNSFWWRIANRLFEGNQYFFRWDDLFKTIPFNDPYYFRKISSPWLDKAMVWIYQWGFVLSLWICLIRSFWTRSIRKMLSYALSGHMLQFPLILPFYNLVLLREVWWVQGRPDLLNRPYTGNDLLVSVMNSFPSMHTSISFAMLLLALREKDRIFKYTMVVYCASIIFSTLYLQIHWVIDVFAGMLFAYGVVKISDGLLAIGSRKFILKKWKSTVQENQAA